jgi:hypothetical protein
MPRRLTPGRLERTMKGIITGRDVLRHSITILRLWGPSTYLRCLYAMLTRRSVTFLEVIHQGDRYPT